MLEGLVLQEPGEEQVPGLEQCHVLVVFHFAGRKEPGSFDVQERRGDHQELAGFIQRPFLAVPAGSGCT